MVVMPGFHIQLAKMHVMVKMKMKVKVKANEYVLAKMRKNPNEKW
jgi:hypothetical protein